MKTAFDADPIIQEIAHDCVLTRTRLLTRALTSMYDEALRPFDIGAAQFALLVMIAALGGARRADIGRINRHDPSTLTRNLRLLLDAGWIEDKHSDGTRLVSLTRAGRRLLHDAAPAWRGAQREAQQMLGAATVTALRSSADRLMHGT